VFHSSVAVVAGGTLPPKAKTPVLVPPVPPKAYLPPDKSATSVQVAQFHNSDFVCAVGPTAPPNAKAEV